MMARVLMNAVFAFAVAVALVVGVPAQAQTEKAKTDKTAETTVSGMRVATVDIQKLVAESKAGKSIQKQLLGKREAIQSEASSLEQALQADQKKLMEERGKLSEEAFAQKQIEFEKRLLEARGKLQNSGRFLDKAANDAFNELRGNITEIVYEMAASQGIDLVLTQQNVIAAAKSTDITADVMKTLDQKVPDIKLKDGKADPAAAKAEGKAKPGKG